MIPPPTNQTTNIRRMHRRKTSNIEIYPIIWTGERAEASWNDFVTFAWPGLSSAIILPLLSFAGPRVYAAAMVKLTINIESLYITMKENQVDGTDRITVFQVFIHFLMEADKMNMSEGNANSDLPTYLAGRAENQFTTIHNVVHAGKITCWLEVIHFYLQTYPTPNVIRDVVAAWH